MFLKNSKEKITWEHPHFWWDALILISLWAAAIFMPQKVDGIALAQILRILALIATLEMGSFIAYQVMGKNKSILLQGFLGGLASSTTVFVQMTRDQRFSKLPAKELASALLLATLAMLVEAFFIALGLSASNLILFAILLQSMVLAFFVRRYLNESVERTTSHDEQFQINHPIVWKRVLKLSLFIAFLIASMKFITLYLPIPNWLMVFVTSLLEAHAVLAAVLLEKQDTSILILYTLITLGHCCSKSFFVWRSDVKELPMLVARPLLLIVAIAAFLVIIAEIATI